MKYRYPVKFGSGTFSWIRNSYKVVAGSGTGINQSGYTKLFWWSCPVGTLETNTWLEVFSITENPAGHIWYPADWLPDIKKAGFPVHPYYQSQLLPGGTAVLQDLLFDGVGGGGAQLLLLPHLKHVAHLEAGGGRGGGCGHPPVQLKGRPLPACTHTKGSNLSTKNCSRCGKN